MWVARHKGLTQGMGSEQGGRIQKASRNTLEDLSGKMEREGIALQTRDQPRKA